MSTLRMVLIEMEVASPEMAAQVLRMAIDGMEAPVTFAAPPAAPDVEIEEELPTETALEPPKTDPRPRKQPRPRATESAPEPKGPSPADDSIAGQILTLLQKRPMSSIELGEALKRRDDMKAVYNACSRLKGAGHIVNQVDETDGTRRYALAKGA